MARIRLVAMELPTSRIRPMEGMGVPLLRALDAVSENADLRRIGQPGRLSMREPADLRAIGRVSGISGV